MTTQDDGARREAERTLAAEARFVEEGHHVRLSDGGSFTVASDSRPGLHYTVEWGGIRFVSGHVLLTFSCSCPAGTKSRTRPPGHTSCKHAAGVARRLERDGWAMWVEGVWHATPKALAAAPVEDVVPVPGRPRNGLPPWHPGARGEVCHGCDEGIDQFNETHGRDRVESNGWVWHDGCLRRSVVHAVPDPDREDPESHGH